jgi:hypothetical protein
MRCPFTCRLILTVALAWAAGNRPADGQAAEWADSRVVGPFVCRADFSLTDIQGTLDDLAQLQAELVRSLHVPAAGESVELYLFHDKTTYTRYVRRYLPNVPYRRALYVKGRGPGRVFAYWSRQFEVDLRHECTHALLHASLPVVPLWLDEGLAQCFETPASQRRFGDSRLGSLRWNVQLGAVTKLEDLEKMGDLLEMGQTQYRDAWAWTHFMVLGPAAAREELVGLLADIRRGVPAGPMSARLRRRLPNLERQFAEHFAARP